MIEDFERKVYFNRLKNPLFALRTLLFLVRRYSNRLLYRLLRPYMLYPHSVKLAWLITRLAREYPSVSGVISENTEPKKCSLILATTVWEFSGGKQWSFHYEDVEDLAVLSR